MCMCCGWREGEFAKNQAKFKKHLCRLEYDIVSELYEVARAGYGNPPKNGQPENQWNSDCVWTRRMKERLWYLGHREGYMVYPRFEGEEKDKGANYPNFDSKGAVLDWLERAREKERKLEAQWLFDLCWVVAPYETERGKFDWTRMTGMPLACECEWTAKRHDILDDFLKLTFIPNQIRLFIYTNEKVSTPNDRAEHPVELCRAACPAAKGFRYLLIGISRNNGFQVDAWTT